MSRPPRLTALLPLKIKVITDGHIHLAHTLDISMSGVKIVMPVALEPGSEIEIEYKRKRARGEVVWSRPRKGVSDYLIGICLHDDGQRFWLVNFAPRLKILESVGKSDEALRTTRNRNGG